VSGASPANGIALEAEYAPALPTTITGAYVTSDAGDDTEASLYDNSTDSDVPPSSVAVRIGRSVSITASITPDCTVDNPSDEVTVIVTTTAGERTLHATVDGFSQAIHRICAGPVQLALSHAHRDGHLVTGTYDTAPVGERVTLSLRGTAFTADPIVLEPGSGGAQWTIRTVQGCSVATGPVPAVATYDSGRQVPLHMVAPGRQVCGGG
ncbi:MAG: hypothetical protein ACJ73J_07695, partial [Actinomycetes bacterium]